MRAAARRQAAAPVTTPAPAVPRRACRDATPGGRAWTWPVAGVVALLACIVYANSLGGGLFYDDTNAVVQNVWVRSGDLLAIVREPSWWSAGRGHGWRPTTTLTFVLNHLVHGLSPSGYHALNVALHAGVSVLVLAVFARVTCAPLAAAIAAALFAVHPVHTEAVASVVGRAELLAAAGFFAAWLLLLRADERRAAGGAGRRRAALLELAAAAVFVVALLAKENAAMLLPVLLLADVLFPRAGRSARATVRAHAPRYLLLAAALVLVGALRRMVLGRDAAGIEMLDNPLVVLPPAERLLTAIKVAGLYAWRLLVPLRLSADYSYDQIPAVRSPFDPAFAAGLAVVVGVGVLVWRTWRNAPAVAFAAAFVALTFAMVSNLVVLIGTVMAERLVYLPSAGFCLLLGLLVARLAAVQPAAGTARRAGGAEVRPRAAGDRVTLRGLVAPPLVIPLALLLLLYAVRTWTRNEVWRDPLTFFSRMVVDAPRSARSHRELGGALADAGRSAEARGEFERALAIKPGDPATLYNLGNALLQAQQIDAAIDAYRQALAVKPDFVDAMVNLGNAESMRGDHRAALAWMRRALDLTPRSASLRMNVANTLFRLGLNEEARAEYVAALALAPDAPEVLTNYGAFLLAQGEIEAAGDAYEKAAASGVPMAHVGLVAAYRARGRWDDARRAQTRAATLFPQNAAVRQMGEVLQRDLASMADAPPRGETGLATGAP